MKKVMGKILPWLPLVGVFIFAVIMLTTVTPMKTVETGSMVPTLPVKSRILIHEEPSYKPGQIITFHADNGELVTHRLMKYAKNGDIITKGDANPTRDYWDEPVTKSDVLGKVIYMTPVTTAQFWTSSDFWRSPQGIGAIACLLIIALAMMWNVEEKNTSTTKSEKSLFSPNPL